MLFVILIPTITLLFAFFVYIYFFKEIDLTNQNYFVGSKGYTVTSIPVEGYGLISVKNYDGSYKILKAMTYKEEIKKNQLILVVKYIDNKDMFMVEPFV